MFKRFSHFKEPKMAVKDMVSSHAPLHTALGLAINYEELMLLILQYQQCGGKNWKGPTTCVSGYKCKVSPIQPHVCWKRGR